MTGSATVSGPGARSGHAIEIGETFEMGAGDGLADVEQHGAVLGGQGRQQFHARRELTPSIQGPDAVRLQLMKIGDTTSAAHGGLQQIRIDRTAIYSELGHCRLAIEVTLLEAAHLQGEVENTRPERDSIVYSWGSVEKPGSKTHTIDLQLGHSSQVEFDSTYDER